MYFIKSQLYRFRYRNEEPVDLDMLLQDLTFAETSPCVSGCFKATTGRKKSTIGQRVSLEK